MDARRARILVSALFLLGFSLYNFLTYTATTSFQVTLAIQPGLAEDIGTTRNSGDIVNGQFQENSGLLVRFYILNSAQFAAHQTGGSFNYLYSMVDVASGGFSYTVPVQDTYYFFFDHGTGLSNTAETVYFQRSYLTHDGFRLGLGFAFLAIAAMDFVFAFRTKPPRPQLFPSPPPAQPPPSPQPPA